MFGSAIIWKGLVYTALMIAGKMACGAWLLRISFTPAISAKFTTTLRLLKPRIAHLWARVYEKSTSSHNESPTHRNQPPTSSSQQARNPSTMNQASDHASIKPRSIYPASIIGCAMTARGEIGFLISSVAESNNIFSTAQTNADKNSEIFLIVTWAIMLCTILGPLAVGLVVRRVEQLQQGVQRQGRVIRGDVLGVWGIS